MKGDYFLKSNMVSYKLFFKTLSADRDAIVRPQYGYLLRPKKVNSRSHLIFMKLKKRFNQYAIVIF